MRTFLGWGVGPGCRVWGSMLPGNGGQCSIVNIESVQPHGRSGRCRWEGPHWIRNYKVARQPHAKLLWSAGRVAGPSLGL